MAADFDLRRFLQRAPRQWLKRYFDETGALPDFDWQSIKKLKVEPLVDAFIAIPDARREPLTSDFRNLALLSRPAGKVAIIDEARFHGEGDAVASILEHFEDFGDCAFWARLERTDLWDGAMFLAAADSMQRKYWRKRVNLPLLGRLPTPGDGEKLAKAVAEVMMRHEARGQHCVVHQVRRGALEYYFAYPQDHPRTSIEFEDGEQTKRPHKPAFEIIFVHDDAGRSLSIWHEGRMDRVAQLQVAFAEAVIGEEIPQKSAKDNRVYDLSRFLSETGYQFEPAPELGIQEVQVHKVFVKVKGPHGHKVQIELYKNTPPHVLWQRLSDITREIKPTLLEVHRIGLKVDFVGDRRKDRVTKTLEIGLPNFCKIADGEFASLLERLLQDHGIEPKAPIEAMTDDDN